MYITVDRNNSHLSQHYNIQGNRIEKINKYGRYQLLSQEVVPIARKSHFIIYFEKITFGIFSFGVVSQKRRNYQNSHESPHLISYFGKTGAIWEYS